MKKEISTIKSLTLALLFGIGTLFASGATWFEPGVAPTGNNTVAPVNTSSDVQVKNAGLNIISDGSANLYADILSVFGTTYLADTVNVGKVDGVYTTSSNNMNVTGALGINLDEGVAITGTPQEAIDVNGQVRFGKLSSLENPDAVYPAPVCITTNGTLYLCPQPGELFSFLVSATPTVTNQSVYIDTFENNADDHNCSADVSFSAGSTGGVAPITFSWKARSNADAPLIQINGLDASTNAWISVGSGGTTNFHVREKNPQMWNRDDWTVQLTATDGTGATSVITRDFDVWTIAECKD